MTSAARREYTGHRPCERSSEIARRGKKRRAGPPTDPSVRKQRKHLVISTIEQRGNPHRGLVTRPKTQILVDGGDPRETEMVGEFIGFVDGQTTNPSLIAKNPKCRSPPASG
jgi:hypothetical protein